MSNEETLGAVAVLGAGGTMGGGMAANAAAAGIPVRAWNRTAAKLDDLATTDGVSVLRQRPRGRRRGRRRGDDAERRRRDPRGDGRRRWRRRRCRPWHRLGADGDDRPRWHRALRRPRRRARPGLRRRARARHQEAGRRRSARHPRLRARGPARAPRAALRRGRQTDDVAWRGRPGESPQGRRQLLDRHRDRGSGGDAAAGREPRPRQGGAAGGDRGRPARPALSADEGGGDDRR